MKRKRLSNLYYRFGLLLLALVAVGIPGTLLAQAAQPAKTITLNQRNVRIAEIFDALRKQAGLVPMYDNLVLDAEQRMDAAFTDATVAQVMDAVLKGRNLEWTIKGKNILIKKKVPDGGSGFGSGLVSQSSIAGRITDTAGRSLQGATVRLGGTEDAPGIATLTDRDGRFILYNVAPGTKVTVSYMGFITQEVPAAVNMAVILQPSTSELQEVPVNINTGYQQISKERFVGSYQQLDSAAFHSRPGMGILDRLDGRVNSIFFDKKFPGGGSGRFPSVMIRGLSTLGPTGASERPTSFAPLIVVDNFPMPENFRIENINQNDVESVTMLTDAVAASIWGARSGNGVIVITTKQGKYGQRFQIDFSSNVTIQERPNLYFYDQITPSEFIDIEQYSFYKGAYDGILGNTFSMPAVSPAIEILDRQRSGLLTESQAKSQIDVLRNHDIRQQLNQYLYRNSAQQQHYLSVRGGTHNLAYQLSGGYNRSMNNIQESKPTEQYTLNTNTSFKPYKNLEIVSGINLAFGKDQSTNQPPLPTYPYARLADEQGNPLAVPNAIRQGYLDTVGGGNLLDWHYRPLDEVRFAEREAISRFIRLNAGINYQFQPWLKAGVQYLFQNTFAHTRTFYSSETYYTRNLINQFTDFNQSSSNLNLRYPVPLGGILDVGDNLVKDYNLRATLAVNKDFSDDHQLNGLVAWEISDSKGGYASSVRTYGYDPVIGTSRGNIDYLNTYTNYYAPSPGLQSFIENGSGSLDGDINRFVSLLANAAYSFRNRYSVYASARRDGANLFGVATNSRWKPLWSAGASWEVSQEKFFNFSALPYLKLRGSYGYTGNSNNSLSGVLTFRNNPFPDAITGLPFSFPNYAANSGLKWEEVGITNLAMDFGLLKQHRISGSFELYRKKAKDLIAQAPNPISTGVASFVRNYASLKTDGYEIKIHSKNFTRSFDWNTEFGWSYAKTIVDQLFTENGHRVSDYLQYDLNAFPGQIIFGLTSYRWAGLDPLSGDPLGYYQGQVSKNYNGIANDSIQNQVFHGSSLPLSTAFLRNTFSWKGLSVAFNLTGRFQYYFREPSIDISSTLELLRLGGISTQYYDRWQKPGDEAITNIPSIYYPTPGAVSARNSFYQLAEIQVKRGDNIRLQDINVSYQWRNIGNTRLPFQTINLFAYLNHINWIIWRASDSDWDPDFTGGALGVRSAAPSRTWTVGATLNF